MSEVLDFAFGADWRSSNNDESEVTFKEYMKTYSKPVQTSFDLALAYTEYALEENDRLVRLYPIEGNLPSHNKLNCLKDSGYGVALEHLGLLAEKEGQWAPEYICNRGGGMRDFLEKVATQFDTPESRNERHNRRKSELEKSVQFSIQYNMY